MQVSLPGLTADDVLRTFESEAFTLFLGAAIAAAGLVAAGIAVLRPRRASLLICFALFAVLYGSRMWIQTSLFEFIFGGSKAFLRLPTAINYVVPVPAFLFFDGAGFLRRKARVLTYGFFSAFAVLVVATLLTGPSDLYQQANNVLVIGALVLLLTEPMYDHSADRDFIIARRGLLIFAGLALWDNVSGVFNSRLPRIESLGFVVLLACLGYVAARQAMQREQQLADIQKELEVARRIQLSILPAEFPTSGTFDVAARYIPMTSVAGDFYDYVLADDSHAGLLIADVSGHGVPAALIASMVKLAATSQRAQAEDPAALLLGMNSALRGNTQSQFVTAAYVYLDAKAKIFRYSAAGHPPMLLLREGKVLEIAENGLMLGAFDFASYETRSDSLQQGDRLLLYTDGIVEAANSAGEFFGQENLSNLLQETSALTPRNAADHIIGSVQRWASSQDDDLTVLVCDCAA
ncbi:MAG TPA: PP2C family protein-serine/threonine phosphatase [Candidatus Sulfotelmatobacter sp.]|nr:PP2C family protein-serine/threonine phosphatase [Candidatus Sulfotelmatobacter sp.]